MSETPFPQIDTPFSSLDVLASDPHSQHNQSATAVDDPSSIDTLHPNWTSHPDLLSPHTLLDGVGSQQPSQSSADLFWYGNQNIGVSRPQADFDMGNQALDVHQALAGIVANSTQYPTSQSQNYHAPTSSTMSFDHGQQMQEYHYPQSNLFGNLNQSDGSELLSRQSSYSSFTSLSNDGFTSNSNEGFYDTSSMGSQLLPPFQPTASSNVASRPVLPPLQVNAFSTPSRLGRPRSTSRITPYNRHHRSTSISTVASFDSTAPMSSASVYAPFQPPSLASPQRGLAQGMGKMSLHHRRTSSKNSQYSTVKKQPSRSILSRPNRSASMSVLRATDSAPFDFSNPSAGTGNGINHSREDQIQASLQEKAENVSQILSTTQQDKARTAWSRHWLQKAYVSATGFTVPRQGLYHSYCLAAQDYGLKPINAASFGKAVRAAYPGIRTRRLGHRGNSKYHYVSLRPALDVEAQRLNAFPDSNGRWFRNPGGGFGFRAHENIGSMDMMGEERDDEDFGEHEDEEEDVLGPIKRSSSTLSLSQSIQHRLSGSDDFTARPSLVPPRMGMMRRHTTSVASSSVPPPTIRVSDLSDFPQWEEVLVACPGLPEDDLRSFWQGFEGHQQELIDYNNALQLDDLEHSCRQHWLGCRYTDLCQNRDLSEMVHRAMAATYDHIIGILLDSADSTSLPDLKSLSDLAGSLEETMEVAFTNFSLDFKVDKLVLTRNTAHLMQRVSEFGQVISALSMITDGRASALTSAWHGLNLEHIVEQYINSISCDIDWVQKVLNEFGSWLDYLENMPGRQHTKAIRKMVSWLDSVIAPFAQEGVLDTLPAKCTFITSHIMRAFTLSSEPHFGTFQLIKTLIDDYITIAAARHAVFAPHNDHDLNDGLEDYNGLKVDIPRLGDGSFDPDPATAVPAWRLQHPLQMSTIDNQTDSTLFGGLASIDGMATTTFSYNDQQMVIPQSDAMSQFLPKSE